MEEKVRELQITALKNGIVIDHIPSEKVFAIVELLNLKKYNEVVTVAINLKSTSLGKKGIIKIEDKDGKDRDYPMTYKEAFRKVSHHFGFSKKKLHIQVLLGNDRLFWVFNKNGKTKSVDMLTGKVYNATLGKGNDVYRGKDDE